MRAVERAAIAASLLCVSSTLQGEIGAPRRGPSLQHQAGVESRRKQTELRVQQRLHASRGAAKGEDPAGRARREHGERASLDALGARQQREASAVEQSLRGAPAAEAGARRHLTLERYEREQAAQIRRGATVP